MTEESPEPGITRYVEIAKRFLHTAVVVDDEARMQPEQPVPLKTPDRRNRSDAPENADAKPARGLSLDAAALSRAFAQQGVVCGVLVPAPGELMTETIVRAAARADVVILDWQLGGDGGKGALTILDKLRDHDDQRGERIRLVVIYTGEPDLHDILQRVQSAMPEGTEMEEDALRLRYRNCRVMLFAKNQSLLSDDDRAFASEEGYLPTAVIRAWVEMDAGVLPSLALRSLTAVRENAHAVLAKFRRDLDPAFMTHRACLPFPENAEQHVVDQIASELRAVMAEQMRTGSTAHSDTLEASVRKLWRTKKTLKVRDEEISYDDVVKAVVKGEVAVKALWSDGELTVQRVRDLTRVLTGGDVTKKAAKALDLEFSWLMTARTVRGGEPRALHLGVVVEEDGDVQHRAMLLCLMPLCDSVRLGKPTQFLFAPLEAPGPPAQKALDAVPRELRPQLVVRHNGTHNRRRVVTQVGGWQQIEFTPNRDQMVVAEPEGKEFWFRTCSKNSARRFRWLGELRMEWAQHFAHTLGARMTRVATKTPEWLRRQER